LNFRLNSPADSLKQINASVLQQHSKRFGTNVGDLTSFLDEHSPSSFSDDSGDKKAEPAPLPLEQYDLCDWLQTIQTPDTTYLSDDEQKKLLPVKNERARHALAQWRKDRSLQWFVAAVSGNDVAVPGNEDLLDACRTMPEDSPAYLTACFYSINTLIKAGKKAEARARLSKLLSRNDLPLSARNIFLTQKQMVCQTVPEFIGSITQSPVSICYMVDDIQFPDKWQAAERLATYYSTPATVCDIHAADLNSNLPQSFWIRWAKDKTVPAELHKQLVKAAWTRSVILDQPAGLEDDLTAAYPALKSAVAAYKRAQRGAEKQFALACLIFKNRGISPFLMPVDHHQTIDEFNYYQGNFWLPAPASEKERLSSKSDQDDFFQPQEIWYRKVVACGSDRVAEELKSYDKPVLRDLLTEKQSQLLNGERMTMAHNLPALLLSKPVIAWAKAHPDDPRNAEMLYCAVKLPLWTAQEGIASQYSKQALALLHARYPNNAFTKKLKWSY
ncbi:MAG TPA: hypothetical protein V6C72_01430, partial [Chroococcales cyanobacterium]